MWQFMYPAITTNTTPRYTTPHDWVKHVLGIQLWSMQQQILHSVFTERYTAVKSCHAIGKTYIAAVAFLAFMHLKRPCKIITSAPTHRQVKDLLWSEINHLHSRIAHKSEGVCLTQRYKMDSSEHYGVGISPRDAVDFQGYHSDNILVILDEAPGVRNEVIEGAESLMSSGDAHWLSIGNPTENAGHFFEAFSKDKWNTFDVPYHVTPNFTGEDIPDSIKRRLISPQWVEERRDEWGEDDPRYQSRVLAQFPDMTEDQLISRTWIDEAIARYKPIDRKAQRQELGDAFKKGVLSIDVARFGDDLTVYSEQFPDQLDRQHKDAKKDTVHVANRAAHIFRSGLFEHIRVDDVAVGGGVTDNLRRLRIPVIPVNGGESAYHPDFYNRRAEMHWAGRNFIKDGGAIAKHPRLTMELMAPKYDYTAKGQIRIEEKDAVKARIGVSPDYADSYHQGVGKAIIRNQYHQQYNPNL